MKDKQKSKLEYANFIWYDIQFSLKKTFCFDAGWSEGGNDINI